MRLSRWLRWRSNAELDEEIRAHLELEIEENLARGMSPREARRAAKRRFGSAVLVTERARAADPLFWIESLARDVRHSIRTLRRSPGFTLAAVLSLALGIGGSVAAYSVVGSVLFRPLPVADAARLVLIDSGIEPGDMATYQLFPRAGFRGLSELQTLSGLAAVSAQTLYPDRRGSPEQWVIHSVVGDYFDVLGVSPFLGRLFTAAEGLLADGTAPAVLSYGDWQTRWGQRADVLGEVLRLENANGSRRIVATVVGVAPPGVDQLTRALDAPSLWLPAPQDNSVSIESRERMGNLDVIGRLAPAESLESLRAELSVLNGGFRANWAFEWPGPGEPVLGNVTPLFENVVSAEARRTVLIFAGVVAMVFLIALMNVIHLQLGQLARTEHEMFVRRALGASGSALLRRGLAASLVLSLAGAALGVALAVALGALAHAFLPPLLPRWDEIGIDGGALAFASLVVLAVSVTMGVVPALRTSSRGFHRTVGDAATHISGRSSGRVGRVVTCVEAALSIVLLVGAGLLTMSLYKILSVEYGFESDGVLAVEIDLPARYDREARDALGLRLEEEVGLHESVDSVAVVYDLPGLSRRTSRAGGIDVANYLISEDYLDVVQIPLLRGRAFDQVDVRTRSDVVLVSDSLARMLWGGEDPIGRRIDLLFGDPEVIGVVGNVRDYFSGDLLPATYLPYGSGIYGGGVLGGSIRLAVRTGDTGSASERVRAIVRQAEPDSIVRLSSLDSLLAGQAERERIQTTLLLAFAAVAVLLAMLGVYSVVGLAVARRTREIGVRVALGASRRTVVIEMMRIGVAPALAGIVVGVLGALAMGELLRGYLFGVEPTDPGVYGAVSIVGLTLAVLAAWIPARRAATVDPLVALRLD